MKSGLIRLLRNLTVISIPLILISVYTFCNPMGCLSVEYPMWAEEKDYVNRRTGVADREDPGVIIIGDSRGKSSLIPAGLTDDASVYNISIGGATPVEMYYAVRNYIRNHEKPEYAFIVFAPYHLCDMDNWDQTLYYNYLSLPELMDAEMNAAGCRDRTVQYDGWAADILSFRLRFPNKYLDAVYTSRFGGNLETNLAKYESVRKEYGYTAFGEEEGNDGVNYETHHPVFDKSDMVDHYYTRLLTLLHNEGVRVIIEQAPMNRTSDEVISEEFRRGFESYMDGIQAEFPDITVEKDIPVYDNSYFGDNNHMNRRGAEKYTQEIRDKYSDIFT